MDLKGEREGFYSRNVDYYDYDDSFDPDRRTADDVFSDMEIN